MIKKYLNIGVVVGTAITIERLIRQRAELFEEFKDSSGSGMLGGVVGLHIGNLFNVLAWPVSLVGEIEELIRGE